MASIEIQALPPKTSRGTIVRFVEQVGELSRDKIGAIEIRGRTAIVEVPNSAVQRLCRLMDGAKIGVDSVRVVTRSANTEVTPNEHFTRLLRWIDLEGAAEAEQNRLQLSRLSGHAAEATGRCLVRMSLMEIEPGLGGRFILYFSKPSRGPLPWNRFAVGSPILLRADDQSSDGTMRGIVCERDDLALRIAFEHAPDIFDETESFRIELSVDEVTRQRQRHAIERVQSAAAERLADLRDILLGEVAPQFDVPIDSSSELMRESKIGTWANSSLDSSQQEAVEFVLSARDVAIVHGPPGTGKTTTLIEVICRSVARGAKVLACAPSNLAVDNLLERLVERNQKAIRIGHPARVLPLLREKSLDVIVDSHPDLQVSRKLVKEAFALQERAAKRTRVRMERAEKQQLRQEARAMLADARRIEGQIVESILDDADIICSTLTGIDSEVLGQRKFDVAIIDEACQTTEPSCWIPALRSERLILAGDHRQLPPTVLSVEAAKAGFAISMLERLMNSRGPEISKQLQVQYRMHRDIMSFSSEEFYAGSLIAHETVADRLLKQLPGVADTPESNSALEFIDTAGAGYDEEKESEGESRLNRKEADIVVRRVQELMAIGVADSVIAVIAPYAAQVRLLRQLLQEKGPRIEVDTVDGFQGREKEVIIISLVRSNLNGEIGFLGDERRMNVAMTRAKRKLILIGDSATICNNLFFEKVVNYFQEKEAYRSVWEWIA